MSPTPGRSILITSAPMKASNCVQVGPDCTCVKSRILTPSSALPAWPCGLRDGGGSPLFALAAGFFDLSATTFFDAALDLASTFALVFVFFADLRTAILGL